MFTLTMPYEEIDGDKNSKSPSATSGCPPAAKARERLEPDSARSKSNDVIFNVADFYPYWGYIWQKMGLKGCLENFQTFIRFGGIVL